MARSSDKANDKECHSSSSGSSSTSDSSSDSDASRDSDEDATSLVGDSVGDKPFVPGLLDDKIAILRQGKMRTVPRLLSVCQAVSNILIPISFNLKVTSKTGR